MPRLQSMIDSKWITAVAVQMMTVTLIAVVVELLVDKLWNPVKTASARTAVAGCSMHHPKVDVNKHSKIKI